MDIAFTLCSKNYLAQALTLYQSFKAKHADLDFIIGLVDADLNDEEKNVLKGYHILGIDEMGIAAIESMKNRYNIIELNTAVKPYYIEHFFNKGYDKVLYLDPDIYVYHALTPIYQNLDLYSFIVTPHFCTPIYDQFLLTEQIVLGTGTFNLGFFAVRNNKTGNALIKWWQRKLYEECILDLSKGYFVDQKWMNLSICHFDNYLIDKNPGLNVAHWNLHERHISLNDANEFMVNEKYPLLFYHFSSYKPNKPEQIADWQNRFSFNSRTDIKTLFSEYREKILNNQYEYFLRKKPAYGFFSVTEKDSLKAKVKNKLIQIVKSL